MGSFLFLQSDFLLRYTRIVAVTMKLLLFFALVSCSSCQDLSSNLANRSTVTKSYICPPQFIRQGHRCYFFSKEAVTWHEAIFKCRDMRSNLAIIQNRNQDKLIRSFLGKKTLEPLERWLGAVYDWKKMTWKWASSGKPLSFNGFARDTSKTDPETLRWHCVIMDPSLHYLWNSRSCIEKNNFICQARLKTANNREKKKLQRQYKVNKDNQLNEIPVPSIPGSTNSSRTDKSYIPITYHFEVNNLSDKALYAYKSPELSKSKRTRRVNTTRNRKRNLQRLRPTRLANGTSIQMPYGRNNRKRQNKKEDNGRAALRWKTYRKKEKLTNPLYPHTIVEEYNYVRDNSII